MDLVDLLRLGHPTLAVILIVPLVGIVSRFAWQTRQRRLSLHPAASGIPSTVGAEHVSIGRLLANGVVGICLIGFLDPITKTLMKNQVWERNPFQVIFVALMFAVTLIALGFLNHAQSQQRLWRVIFAVLTIAGVLVLGWEDGVYRRDYEWYFSHFYSGITVTILMILSLAIVPEIYQDRTHRWRRAHILLNSLALLLFIMQGMTGVRDLLEIPLSWQEPYLNQCNYAEKTCLNHVPSTQWEGSDVDSPSLVA